MAWLDKEGLPKAHDLWEVYVKGPNLDTDLPVSMTVNLTLTAMFTVASILRGYFVLRYYNRKQAVGS